MATTSEAKESPKTEFIEYLGDPGNKQGVDFLTAHSLPKSDSIFKRGKVSPTKDLTWERDPSGPAPGFPGARLLLPTEDLDPAVVALLKDTPGYRLVSE